MYLRECTITIFIMLLLYFFISKGGSPGFRLFRGWLARCKHLCRGETYPFKIPFVSSRKCCSLSVFFMLRNHFYNYFNHAIVVARKTHDRIPSQTLSDDHLFCPEAMYQIFGERTILVAVCSFGIRPMSLPLVCIKTYRISLQRLLSFGAGRMFVDFWHKPRLYTGHRSNLGLANSS